MDVVDSRPAVDVLAFFAPGAAPAPAAGAAATPDQNSGTPDFASNLTAATTTANVPVAATVPAPSPEPPTQDAPTGSVDPTALIVAAWAAHVAQTTPAAVPAANAGDGAAPTEIITDSPAVANRTSSDSEDDAPRAPQSAAEDQHAEPSTSPPVAPPGDPPPPPSLDSRLVAPPPPVVAVSPAIQPSAQSHDDPAPARHSSRSGIAAANSINGIESYLRSTAAASAPPATPQPHARDSEATPPQPPAGLALALTAPRSATAPIAAVPAPQPTNDVPTPAAPPPEPVAVVEPVRAAPQKPAAVPPPATAITAAPVESSTPQPPVVHSVAHDDPAPPLRRVAAVGSSKTAAPAHPPLAAAPQVQAPTESRVPEEPQAVPVAPAQPAAAPRPVSLPPRSAVPPQDDATPVDETPSAPVPPVAAPAAPVPPKASAAETPPETIAPATGPIVEPPPTPEAAPLFGASPVETAAPSVRNADSDARAEDGAVTAPVIAPERQVPPPPDAFARWLSAAAVPQPGPVDVPAPARAADRMVASVPQPERDAAPAAASPWEVPPPPSPPVHAAAQAAPTLHPHSTVAVGNPERLAAHVGMLIHEAQESRQQLSMRLSPPELGSVLIQVAAHDGVVTATLETQSAAAQQTLLDNLPHLQDSLAQLGATVDRIEVTRVEPKASESAGAALAWSDGRSATAGSQQRQDEPRRRPERPALKPRASVEAAAAARTLARNEINVRV